MSCNQNCRQGRDCDCRQGDPPEWVWISVSRAVLVLSAFVSGAMFYRVWIYF